jgi:hypothetical protein
MTRKSRNEQLTQGRTLGADEAQSERYADHIRDAQFTAAKARAAESGLTVEQELENDVRAERARARLAEKGRVRERPVYGPGSEHSWFADFIGDQIARQHEARVAGATVSGKNVGAATFASIDLGEARKRLASVELRDVTSADPGAAAFLGPGFVGELFNTAARAEGSLAAALGLRPLPRGVKRIDIPRFDTGSSAAVQNPEGSAVSQTDVDGASQPGNIATISGKQTISVQGLEFLDSTDDEAIARDLGRAIGAATDLQLVAGSNASGQTLGLASVTGIKTVTWTDASPTSQEAVGKFWAAYDQIANGGQGVADPDSYIAVVHPRRLAWFYSNAQNAQSVDPRVPGGIVASAGLRTNLGGGTEDEAYLLLADELPVYASPVRLIVDDESASGNMQVKLVAYRFVGTGFGRAPGAIARLSGSGFIAPVL